MSLLLFTGCIGVNKTKIEILEDPDNITNTVVFRDYRGRNDNVVFRAKYKGKEKMFFSHLLDDKDLWRAAKVLDDDAKNIKFLNKKIQNDIYDEKYYFGTYYENLLCFSKNNSYYGINVNFGGWTMQFEEKFEIEVDDLTELYSDIEKNIAIVKPDYKVLNYGTYKIDRYSSIDFDYFYFINSREIYIYDGKTADLVKTIVVDSDIYEVSGGEKIFIAVKDEKKFKIIGYTI
ncbi:MAG: hypothetical protein PHT03_03905 [Bacilli bacterium]|nr:hypothetical protein [Bacilli bacterium]MDD4388296.1 hypothetical protein [Bacilli bacterium]